MNRRKPTLRSDSQWQSVLSEQINSGMNVSTFCKMHQISISAFYSAKKRLNFRDDEKPFISQPNDNNLSDSVFVQLEPHTAELETSGHSNQWAVELEVGQNIILRVRS